MDWDQYLPEQQAPAPVRDCNAEILGTIAIMNMAFIMLLTMMWCLGKTMNACCVNESAKKKIDELSKKNTTLEKIIFTAMEHKIRQAMSQTDEDLHED